MASSLWLSGIAVLLGGGGALNLRAPYSAKLGQGFPIERVGWLAGCFEMRSGSPVVDEVRMGVRGGSMVGRTSTPRGLEEYELTLIAERQGELVYEAPPSGQPAAVFKANVATADSV